MDKTVSIKPGPGEVQPRRRNASERSVASSISYTMKQLALFRPDHGWAWLCVLAGCFVHVFVGGLDRSFGIFYIELRDYYKVGAAATAGISGAMTSLRLLLGPLASALSNKYGTRKVAVIGGILYATGLTLSAFRPSLAFTYLTLGIMTGVGGAFLFTPTYVCLNHQFEKWRGIAIGVATAGAGIGTFLWPQITFLLLQSGTYNDMMLILGGVSANLILCGVIFRSVNLLINRVRSRANFGDLGVNNDPENEEDDEDAEAETEFKVAEAETELNIPPQVTETAEKKKQRARTTSESGKTYRSTPSLSVKRTNNAKVAASTPSLAEHKRKKSRQSDNAIRQYYESLKQAAQKQEDLIRSVDVVFWPAEATESESDESEESKGFAQCCNNVCNFFKRGARMFDLHLLTNYKFMFLALACCMSNFAYQGIPTLLVHHISIQLNIDRDAVRHIISTIGIADTMSRIISGLLFDLSWFRKIRRFLWTLAIIMLGLVIMLLSWAKSITGFYVLTVCYGITTGVYTSQLTVIVVDTVPSKKLMPNAIGLTIFFRGIGVMLGVYISGLMKDITNTYAASFVLCGSVAVVGGTMFLITSIVCCGGISVKTGDPESHVHEHKPIKK